MEMSPGTVLEGTWEEISQLAPQFIGHRLRLTLLDPAGAESEEQEYRNRVAAVREWLNAPRVQGNPILDDSRDGIYREDQTCDR